MNRSEQMEEALDEIGNACSWIAENCNDMQTAKYMWDLVEKVKAALALPRRNCDVGTAEEQAERMRRKFCAKQKRDGIIDCSLCPIRHAYRRDCTLAWAQMPYEAEKGGES